MRHEIISPIHNLSKYENKIGVTLHLKELKWILYRHVFAHICYVLQELARTEIYVKRSIIPLLIVIKRQTWYQFVCKNMWNIMKEKKWRFYVV